MNAAIHKYKTVKNIKGEKKEKKTEKKNLLANKVLFNLSITKMVLISFFFFSHICQLERPGGKIQMTVSKDTKSHQCNSHLKDI